MAEHGGTSRRFVWAGGAFLAMAATLTAPASAQTLVQALVEAYEKNPRILAARARLKATDEQVAQAISSWRPTVTFTGTYGRSTSHTIVNRTTRVPTSGVIESGTRLEPGTATLTITQPIFRGGREFADLRRAENTIRAERARLHATEQDVFLEVITAYMNVVRDEAVLRLRSNNVNVLQRQLQATRDRFGVGEVTRTDVAQAEASLARADANRILAQGNLEQSRANFANLVGQPPVRLADPRVVQALPPNRELALGLARRHHPTVLTAYFEERAARDAADSIFGELLPTISITGTLAKQYDQTSPGQRSESAAILGTLTVPLYQSGAVTSRLRAAKQTVFQRGNEYAQARRTIVETSTRAWESLSTARSSANAFGAEARANGIALEGVRQEARAGLRTTLDVLDAEQRLLDSQVNIVVARRDVTVSTYQVVASIGRLTAKDLALPVKIYDAEAYYRAIKYLPFGLGPIMSRPPPPPSEQD